MPLLLPAPSAHGDASSDANSQRIAAAMELKRTSRSSVFDNRLPLSWLRLLRAIVSYVLLFSDIPRSGIGVRSLSSTSTMLEPDKFTSFGPWAYSIFQLHKNESALLDAPSARVWSYKFDTTSIAWRAFAEFLGIDAFPACVLYRSKCPATTLSGDVVFGMIDALPTAIVRRHQQQSQQQQQQQLNAQQPVAMALRTKSNFYDKFHHYVLPHLFMNPILRTHQAFYYPAHVLERADFRICDDQSTHSRPRLCDNEWTDFRRSCSTSDVECQSVGAVSHHIVERLRDLQAQYPAAHVDLTVLESSDSARAIRGGLCRVERRDTDVSTILRVRNCSTSALTSAPQQSADECETIFVHDYRYESTIILTDAEQWYSVVMALRAVGQAYFYLRVLALLASCYVTRAAEEKYATVSVWTRWRAAWRLFIRVPTQCVIHGSTFPILCYVCAHAVDAPFTYEVAGDKLTTLNGLFTMSYWDFAMIAAVQMRSLWLLALVARHVMAFFTRHLDPDWSPARGILGFPGFSVSLLSSCTIAGQFRAFEFRDTSILSIFELERMSSTPQAINYATQQRGVASVVLDGMYIDIKLILCGLAFASALAALQSCGALLVLYGGSGWQRRRRIASANRMIRVSLMSGESLWVQSRPASWTPVPYSAGALWPITAACTRWGGSVFSNAGETRLETLKRRVSHISRRRIAPDTSSKTVAPLFKPFAQLRGTPGRRSSAAGRTTPALVAVHPCPASQPASASQWLTWPQTGQASDTLRFLQLHLAHVDTRHPDVDAVVALFNLVLMSDPLVFCALKLAGAGKPLAFFEATSSVSPGRVVLLPLATAYTCFTRDELTLLRAVDSVDLAWSDLIHCG